MHFLRYLHAKPVDHVFNVPKGKIDRLEKQKLKQFLSSTGENKFHLRKLEQLGYSNYPYFVIDPFDRC